MRSTERCERADKLSYPSPEDADAALERLHRLHAAGREDRREASAYLCQYGLDHWHLTSLMETYDRRPLHPSEIESAVAMLQRRVGGGVPAQSRRGKPLIPVPAMPTPRTRPRGPASNYWTQDELDWLNRGLSSAEIMQHIDRSSYAIGRKLFRFQQDGQAFNVTDGHELIAFHVAVGRDFRQTPAELAYLTGLHGDLSTSHHEDAPSAPQPRAQRTAMDRFRSLWRRLRGRR